MITAPLPLLGLIALATVLAFWLDQTVPFFSRVGASLLALALGAVLTNSGVVPASSPVYDAISGPITSLAIAWLLLSVDLRDLKRAGPRMVGAFALAVAGTAVGAVIGAFMFASGLGAAAWRLAGTLTGTYSGGSLNFVAVAREVELPASLFAGATAADALTTGLWLGATLLIPAYLARFFAPVPDAGTGRRTGDGEAPASAEGEHHPFFSPTPISTKDLSVLMALGLVLLVVSEALGRWIPVVPSVLWLTTLALLVGHTKRFSRLPGAFQVGTLALHFFFVVIGIWSRVSEIAAVGAEVFLYTLVVVGVHGVVVYGGGRLARIDVGTLSVASQAAVGGPSSALAVAVSRGWHGLVLPGIIVGLFGYAVGNYLGIAVSSLVRALGVGL